MCGCLQKMPAALQQQSLVQTSQRPTSGLQSSMQSSMQSGQNNLQSATGTQNNVQGNMQGGQQTSTATNPQSGNNVDGARNKKTLLSSR